MPRKPRFQGPRHQAPGHPHEPTPAQAVAELVTLMARVEHARLVARTERHKAQAIRRREILNRAIAEIGQK